MNSKSRHRSTEEVFNNLSSSSSSLASDGFIQTPYTQPQQNNNSMTNKLKQFFKSSSPSSPKHANSQQLPPIDSSVNSSSSNPNSPMYPSSTHSADHTNSPISPILLPTNMKLKIPSPNVNSSHSALIPNESSSTNSPAGAICASSENTIILKPNSPIQKDYTQEGHLLNFNNGSHQHIIKNTKKQEKLPNTSNYLVSSLTSWSKNKAIIDNSYSLIEEGDLDRLKFNNLGDDENYHQVLKSCIGTKQKELIDKLSTKITAILTNKEFNNSEQLTSQTLVSKYGKPKGIVGKGAYGVVKVVSKTHPVTKINKFFAVKEIKKKPDEKVNHFVNRLISEFSISSTLNHPNIIKTIDLMKDVSGHTSANLVFGEIMEYCHGGDLYQLIVESEKENGLPLIEIDCFMKQITRGVAYMHQHGVAHCDLKPENILMTLNGCCKITDFGTSVVFRTAWEKSTHLTSGCCGSEPYVAPEEYNDEPYDPTKVDYWALGIIYMTLATGSFLWKSSRKSDPIYKKYLSKKAMFQYSKEGHDIQMVRKGEFTPIETLKTYTHNEKLGKERKKLIYRLLESDTKQRLTAADLLDSDWMMNVRVCAAGSGF